ncbi:MAG: hypothetical protein UIH27_03185, partial [Ruminococcus sp.]|nr:hypothetical protein [Ruminococcus sp.]
NDWSDGVDLYYGNGSDFSTYTRIAMTDTGATTLVAANLSTVKTGAWKIYSVQLTQAQVNSINYASCVGFAKKNASNRTDATPAHKITYAGKSYMSSYATTQTPIKNLNGATFIINGTFNTANETVTYRGYWRLPETATA